MKSDDDVISLASSHLAVLCEQTIALSRTTTFNPSNHFPTELQMSPPSLQDANTGSSEPSSLFDVDKFNRDGYLIIPDFLPPETVTLLRQRVSQLLDEFSLEGHPMTKFSTGEQEAHVGDHVHPCQRFSYI
jgi:hypothetical protein